MYRFLMMLAVMSAPLFGADAINLANTDQNITNLARHHHFSSSSDSSSSSDCNDHCKDQCKRGKRGARGPQGFNGENGRNGENGLPGPAGATGPGAIIPYASGTTVTLTELTGAALGFGNSISGISLTPSINTNLLGNVAFSLPRAGTITSLAAYFSSSSTVMAIDPTATIRAQVWISTPPTDAFVPTAAFVDLPLNTATLFPIIFAGDTFNGLAVANVPLPPQTRVLLVFSVTGIGDGSISGYASGGITVD